MKNLIFLICLMIANSSEVITQDNQREEPQKQTVILTSYYEIEMDYHGFFKFLGAKVLNFFSEIEPETLIYTETIQINNNFETGFLMELITNQKNIWFFISSDSVKKSFTHFPQYDKQAMKQDAIFFVAEIRKFMARREKFPDSLTGLFSLDTSKISSQFISYDSSTKIDRERIKIRGQKSKFVNAYSIDITNNDPYISGNILTEIKDGFTIYPFITVHLFSKNIDMIFYLKKLTIEYK